MEPGTIIPTNNTITPTSDVFFEGITPGEDTYTQEALEAAVELVELFGPDLCIAAAVDRTKGLVLLFEEPNLSMWRGWHFNTPICGYAGTGPMTSAQILAMFGFGTYNEIYEMISRGGGGARYTFGK